MIAPHRFLSFGWWNLHNFAHYDPNQISNPRWPKSQTEYDAKRERVHEAIRTIFSSQLPDLLAVCEITRPAAHALATDLPADYRMTIPPAYPHDDGFQVATFFRDGIGFTPEPLIIPTDMEDVTEGTRPMVPVHFTVRGHVIRFVACHWTAFDTDSSRLARERLADVLRRDCHAFLEPDVPTPGITRHVIVVGDLNEEPSALLFDHRLIGRRDRESSHTRHWRDTQVRRVRLYNSAWRFLGEQYPHTGSSIPMRGIAGTYFRDPHDWRTFDHVLVSCGLLTANPPYLDEDQTRVISGDILVDDNGQPIPFVFGSTRGVSDHLPIIGRLALPEVP